MTSAAMIMNYWGTQSDFVTNPGIFNSWLRAYNGYDHNFVVWEEGIEAYTAINDIPMSFGRISDGRNDLLLDTTLSSGNPAIIGVNLGADNNPGHYVVATGKTTANGQPTYSINDPIHGRTTLYAQYNNGYSRIYTFDNSSDDRRLLSITAHSPVELLITDPYGRKEGYDPITGMTWNEIPEAEYFVNTLAPDGGSGTGDDVLESVAFLSTTPLDGQYAITVFGVGNGGYQLVVTASTWGGQVEQVMMDGNATDGSTDTFEINYDPYSGIGDTIFLPIILK